MNKTKVTSAYLQYSRNKVLNHNFFVEAGLFSGHTDTVTDIRTKLHPVDLAINTKCNTQNPIFIACSSSMIWLIIMHACN